MLVVPGESSQLLLIMFWVLACCCYFAPDPRQKHAVAYSSASHSMFL